MKRSFYGKDFDLLDLRGQGLSDLIFDFIPSLEFMFLAVKNGERILGGDIIIKNASNEYIVSPDGWHCGESEPDLSFIETLEYFDKFLKNNKSADWKVSVVTSRYSEYALPLN